MSESTAGLSWVDRYVRDQLSTDEIAEFEIALMDSPALADELETALAIRATLALGPEQQAASNEILPESLSGSGNWQPLALAAMVILALFSTVMFWKSGNDAAALQRQLEQLSQPRTGILNVPVNIMRSSGSENPDVVIKIPTGHSGILLDIELSSAARKIDELHFTLRNEAGERVANWTGQASPTGRAEVMLGSEQVPAELLSLEISSEAGTLIDQRWILFL